MLGKKKDNASWISIFSENIFQNWRHNKYFFKYQKNLLSETYNSRYMKEISLVKIKLQNVNHYILMKI